MKTTHQRRYCCFIAASAHLFAALAVMSATSAVASLPSGYVECEFIQGNGSNARIVTDYTPNPSTDKIEAVFQFPANALANNVNQAIWCARSDGSVKTWTLFVLGTSYRFDYNTTQNAVSGTAINTTEKYTVTVDGNQFSSSGSNGSSHSSSPAAVAGFTSTVQPLVLFSSYTSNTDNNKSNYGKHRLYSFKVWRSGDLIHNLVPAVRESDSAKGLYDIKADKFYPGSGSFTMGDIVVVTDTLEITSSPAGIGSPLPAYGVTNGLAAGSSFTVTCGATPATGAAGTRRYFCTGWKLYDRNGEVVSKGVDDSFSYTHPNPAEYRRLEWQWLYDGGAHDKMIASVIETRPCDIAEGIVKVNTARDLGFLLIVR